MSPASSGLRTLQPDSGDRAIIAKVKQLATELRQLTDNELRERTGSLREIVQQGAECASQEVITTGFALVNESARRTVGIEYYDVQLLAGLALARRTIAEMQTGEGKTYVAALPTLLFALAGRGVHVMTSNAYLAGRDCQLLTPLFQRLGLSVGVTQPQARPDEKRAAYACDVTYGPGYEFGFDYLRDQAALLIRPKLRLGESQRRLFHGDELPELQTIQRGHAFAIVDEIDSVLLDEATSPLILSEGARTLADDPELYIEARNIADQLRADVDYVVHRATRTVRLTAQGDQRALALLKRTRVNGLQRPWSTYVQHALYAGLQLKRDVDYVVDQEEQRVLLVDEASGRIFADRSLREGLHQAIEAKENVPISAEQQPLARITRQRYFRLYDDVCGMTGTASGNEREFWQSHRLTVVKIPLWKPSRRKLLPTRFFGDENAKWAAIVQEIGRIHATNQPILVGTRTIRHSRQLAEQLDACNLPYQLLNGTQDAEEADIVAGAGQAGTITIATNMAGRGTDVKLGPGVAELGGLHVIVTEPHASRRIDRQLMGRCARQGQAGSCQRFVSADDELLVQYSPELSRRIQRAAEPAGEAAVDFSEDLARLQRKTEQAGFARRCQLFAQDDWLEGVLSKLAKEG